MPTTHPPVDSPLPAEFLQRLAELERTYLRETDPIKQSGFSGGAERWRAERSPILNAIPASGSRSRREVPARLDELLANLGHVVAGSAVAGVPETARFIWIDAAAGLIKL